VSNIPKPKLLIIFPCYNEEEVLEISIQRFFHFFHNLFSKELIDKNSRICFVDDGSTDNTWKIIEQFENPYIKAIKLSNNFGHQKALVAAMETFQNQFDAYITLDVDLQDDFTIITSMIEKYIDGYDIVYGVRDDRSSDSFFKRKTAHGFYWFMEFLGVETIVNHADFRLINNKTLNFFLKFEETHLFLRAIFPSIGMNHCTVYYKRFERETGDSKYPIKKMASFALDGITSFSVKPLRYILITGLISTLLAILFFIWAVIQLLLGNVIHGWFSVIATVMFFGGIQTFAIGIIGEYIGKIFMQVKNRPRYLIEKEI